MANPLNGNQSSVENDEMLLTPAMKKAGWASAMDDEGDQYFYNRLQSVSTYDIPVLRDGKWVAQSDDEEDEESDSDGQESLRSAVKKPSLLSSATIASSALLTDGKVKADKSKSLAVFKSKQHSFDTSNARGSQNRRNMKSKSMAVNAMNNERSKSRWQMKNLMMNRPAIPIMNEVTEDDVEDEILTLSPA